MKTQEAAAVLSGPRINIYNVNLLISILNVSEDSQSPGYMADDKHSCTAPTPDLKTFNSLMTIKENTCTRGTKIKIT